MEYQVGEINLGIRLKECYSEDEIDMLVGIGHSLETGQSLFEPDHGVALAVYGLAAEHGAPVAMNNYGWMVLNGLGAPKNIKRAISAFEDAASRGNTLAMVNLGNVYENMEGCTEAEFGDYRTVGNVVFLNKYDAIQNEYIDYKKAAGWYKKAMEHGSAKGAFNYACMLHFGKGVKRNYKKASGIFSELFNINYPGSHFYMGMYYAEGLAVKADYALARRCYILGATTLGDAACYNQLGVMYAEGLGVKRDYNFAMEYYKIAAESGDGLAAANVGWMYYEGDGAERNYAEAVKWYEKAMGIGFELAEESAGPQNTLGWMYQNGLGVAQDYKKAVELYIKAAELGNPDAQSNLGAMYENGLGVAKNRKKAISWYEKAAEQGDPDAFEALERFAGQ